MVKKPVFGILRTVTWILQKVPGSSYEKGRRSSSNICTYFLPSCDPTRNKICEFKCPAKQAQTMKLSQPLCVPENHFFSFLSSCNLFAKPLEPSRLLFFVGAHHFVPLLLPPGHPVHYASHACFFMRFTHRRSPCYSFLPQSFVCLQYLTYSPCLKVQWYGFHNAREPKTLLAASRLILLWSAAVSLHGLPPGVLRLHRAWPRRTALTTFIERPISSSIRDTGKQLDWYATICPFSKVDKRGFRGILDGWNF